MASESTESSRGELIEKVVKIRRCAAVVKGGRRFSFTALVVVGDGRGRVGWGYGKANEVPPAVEKAVKDGSRSMIEVPMHRLPSRTPSPATSAPRRSCCCRPRRARA